ncbi:hypothetical protein CCAN12_430022 [Capnocytophaga canimorsus]|uniref:Uncharacterized protein n=1 Tax=Capnocytophaga canimorsus TaxID=28188 RepID=A0A0B7H7A3_9FLAO|nr:hypothetical protein CCAN12_430022 [Capnocytophaga canimorsus]
MPQAMASVPSNKKGNAVEIGRFSCGKTSPIPKTNTRNEYKNFIITNYT